MSQAPAKKTNAPYLTRPELLAILRHPTRVYCIGVLSERPASIRELAAELDLEDQNVRYHIRQLKEVGLVRLDQTVRRPADGRTLFYRATKRAWFDRATWEQMATPNGATAAIMALMNQDIAQAIIAGTFDRGYNHISRTPAVLDSESYEEMIVLLAETLDGIFEIKMLAEERIGSETETISTSINILQFDLSSLGPAQ